MSVQDVLFLLSSDAVVTLGENAEFAYLLFYSRPDNCCKIAVTTVDRSELVSIWEKDFSIPSGMLKATSPRCKIAIQKSVALQFQFVTRTQLEPEENVDTQIEVRVGRKLVYRTDLKAVPRYDAGEVQPLFSALRPQLEEILKIVESNRGQTGERILYSLFCLEQQSRKVFRRFDLRHETMMKYLNPPIK